MPWLSGLISGQKPWVDSASVVINDDQTPSAELAPDQFDEDTLPTYDLLDEVLRSHIEGGLNADDLVKSGFGEELVNDVLGRLERNEHKRWQMSPAPRVFLRLRQG